MRRSPFELRYRNIEVVDVGPMPRENLEMLSTITMAVVLRKLRKVLA